MKLLNLDDIALDSRRVVKYKGAEYKVKDFNVSEYLKFQRHFAAFSEAYNGNTLEAGQRVIDETKALVKLGVEGFDPNFVDDLNVAQMLALVSMISNLLPEPDAETKEVITEAQEGNVEATAE
jgi:hypothetical protein